VTRLVEVLSRAVAGTRPLWRMLVVIGAGWGAAELGGTTLLTDTGGYLFLTSLLLAIGLYSSTFGIDLDEARRDLRLLVTAVTVGVLAKAALIAAALWTVVGGSGYLVLAVAVAQIDPLSVAALRDRSRMTPRGKAVLAVWAAFDDPITVLLTAYAAPFALTHVHGAAATTLGTARDGTLAYTLQLVLNMALAAVVWLIWRALERLNRPLEALRTEEADGAGVGAGSGAGLVEALSVLTLFVVVGVAAWYSLMLAVACVGLFLRPVTVGRRLDRTTALAYGTAAFMLGVLLVEGIEFRNGLVLGAAAFAAQMVVGWVLGRRLDGVDRIALALGQQNGVTAIILALALEPSFPRAVAIVAPAIVTVNCLHLVTNQAWEGLHRRRVRASGNDVGPSPSPGPQQHRAVQGPADAAPQ